MQVAVKQQDPLDFLYDQHEEQAALQRITDRQYKRLMRAIHLLVRSAIPELVSYELTDQAVRSALLESASRVVRIDQTTRDALRQMILEGYDRGYSIQQIASGVEKEGYRGIEGLFQETWRGRPQTVARTEMQHAVNWCAQNRYRASGVIDQVEIRDDEDNEDGDECHARNGRIVSVDEPVELNHPNCTLMLTPVVNMNAVRSL